MPTYEFLCKVCTKKHEVFLQHFIKDEDRVRACPYCKGPAELTISKSLNFQIKGFCYKNENQYDRHLLEARQAMSEPLTRDEIQALPEIAREEEKKRGLEPGSILNNNYSQGSLTPEDVSKRRTQKKEELAKKAREQRSKVEKHKSKNRWAI